MIRTWIKKYSNLDLVFQPTHLKLNAMKYLICLISICCSQWLIAQDTVKTITHDTIPFTLTAANNISIKAILNDMDTLNLMFHTAAGDVALTKATTSKLTSLSELGTDTVKSWGGESTARYSKGNTVQIGNFSLKNLTIWEDTHSGIGTDGKFGPNFFENKIIEMNFDESIIIIHSALPSLEVEYEQHNLVINRGLMFLEMVSQIEENHYKNNFLIHSGYGGTILYDDAFSNEHKLGEQLKINSESDLRDSHDNIIKTKKAILPILSVGKIQFSYIPVGFFEGTIGRQQMSVMGGNLIKRFNIIFDIQNAHVYLKGNSLMRLP